MRGKREVALAHLTPLARLEIALLALGGVCQGGTACHFLPGRKLAAGDLLGKERHGGLLADLLALKGGNLPVGDRIAV